MFLILFIHSFTYFLFLSLRLDSMSSIYLFLNYYVTSMNFYCFTLLFFILFIKPWPDFPPVIEPCSLLCVCVCVSRWCVNSVEYNLQGLNVPVCSVLWSTLRSVGNKYPALLRRWPCCETKPTKWLAASDFWPYSLKRSRNPPWQQVQIINDL